MIIKVDSNISIYYLKVDETSVVENQIQDITLQDTMDLDINQNLNKSSLHGPLLSNPALPWPPLLESIGVVNNIEQVKVFVKPSYFESLFTQSKETLVDIDLRFKNFHISTNNYQSNPNDAYHRSLKFAKTTRQCSFVSHLYGFTQHTQRQSVTSEGVGICGKSFGRGLLDDIVDLALPLVPSMFSMVKTRRSAVNSSGKIKLKFK